MTLTDRLISGLKNNKYVSVVLIIFAVLVGASQLKDSIINLNPFKDIEVKDYTGTIWKFCGGPVDAGYDGCGVVVTESNGVLYGLDIFPPSFNWDEIKRFSCEIADGLEFCTLEVEAESGKKDSGEMSRLGRWALVDREMKFDIFSDGVVVANATLKIQEDSSDVFAGYGNLNDESQEKYLLTLQLMKQQ
jgi:hypothetical protein